MIQKIQKILLYILLILFIACPVLAQHVLPSYHQGFYTIQRGGIPVHPNLWKNLIGLWSPNLGHTGNNLINHANRATGSTFSNMDSTNWGVDRDGHVLNYNGTDEDVDITGFPDFSGARWSATIWVNVTTWNDNDIFYFFRSTANERLRLQTRMVVADQLFRQNGDNGDVLDTGIGLVTDTWYFLAYTFDVNNFAILYLDGVVQATDNIGLSTSASDISAFSFGSRAGANPFPGNLGTATLHDRVLTPNEIMQMFVDPHALFRTRRIIGKAPVVAAGIEIFRRRIEGY